MGAGICGSRDQANALVGNWIRAYPNEDLLVVGVNHGHLRW